MFKKLLLWVRQQKKRLFGILILLFIFFLCFPFPISNNDLTRTKWCAGYPFHKWWFVEDGSFEQSILLIGDFDAVRYSDRGVWINSGRSVHVDIKEGDFKGASADFVARPLGLGTFLWSYGSFSLDEDNESVILAYPCAVN